jgi:hypothetical protein
MLYNVSIHPTREVLSKLLELILVSIPGGIVDFYQINKEE